MTTSDADKFTASAAERGERQVTVLTHCDKLERGDIDRLRTILDTTSARSSLTIAVHRCAQDGKKELALLQRLNEMDMKELALLQCLTEMDMRLDVGTQLLAATWKSSFRRYTVMMTPLVSNLRRWRYPVTIPERLLVLLLHQFTKLPWLMWERVRVLELRPTVQPQKCAEASDGGRLRG